MTGWDWNCTTSRGLNYEVRATLLLVVAYFAIQKLMYVVLQRSLY